MRKSSLIDATRSNDSFTHNGAITHSTSLSNNLDMFALAGASRRMSESEIIRLFTKAYTEDKQLAYKILFWARDARGGAGERKFFHAIMKHVHDKYPGEFDQLIVRTPEYGYWKDVFMVGKPDPDTLSWLAEELETHPNKNLLAKWFPRKGPWFHYMHKHLGIIPKDLRKLLVGLTHVVETQMCKKLWDDIVYSQVPSVAMHRYRKTFFKRDLNRMTAFINRVKEGKEKINAGVLFPYQLYQALHRGENERAVEAQWEALPNYMADSTERIIPVCDVSGSMTGTPMDISVSLGLYISERNKSIFKDAFITFSSSPRMEYLKGTLAQRMRQLEQAHWEMSTDLQAVFRLILNSAVNSSVPVEDMPTKILIISDMEFDGCTTGKTNLDVIKSKYLASGYEMPEIIFWNVKGRSGNMPAQKDDKGVGLVSGFSPAILKSILKGKIYTPTQLMLDTVMSERYAAIHID